ncbi:flagellar hook protein FlgE [Aestuariivirga litoralis]|uniref:flagellar hook protein FlgE n=1 Tax=Aestuariivirga litoralis TaxID=2650924 RepID=UPI0032B1A3DF
MRTSASGMAAQASRISAVSDNVANSNTVGYKEVNTQFSSMVIDNALSSYNSGSVAVETRRMVDGQGTLVGTNSSTDLAIQGNGFFLVQDSAGNNVITRAGNFVPNSNNELVNAAGYKLMGYPILNGDPSIVVNGYTGLVPITTSSSQLSAEPSTTGIFQANMPYDATAVAAANLPSTNTASSTYTNKSSLVVYGNQGQQVTLDLYFSKTGPDTWEVSAFDQSTATNGGFPYGASGSAPLSTKTLTFSSSNGQMTTTPTTLSLTVPGGQALSLDLTGTTELATNYSVISSGVNGNKASAPKTVEIADDGTVYVAFDNGTRKAAYRIPLATVASADNLNSQSGNVFVTTSESGGLQIGFPGDPGFGNVKSSQLEQSTADIATQFTEMIDAQRTYTANSKVFQTGADLMDVLVNLKR